MQLRTKKVLLLRHGNGTPADLIRWESRNEAVAAEE